MMAPRALHHRRIVVAAIVASAVLAGCQAANEVFRFDPLPTPESYAYQANFERRNGSVVGGAVRVGARDDGVAVSIYAAALRPGTYRLVFHATGNCSSPNAFSAGPPWAPPGMTPVEITVTPSTDGTANVSVRLKGYKLEGPDGLVGKSAVLHEATGTLDAQPNVPNNRLACGVIGQMRTFTF
jgi:Cu-Zn family superoxide dismutase